MCKWNILNPKKLDSKRTALIAGSTGLVGNELARILDADDYYDEVYLPVRRTTDRAFAHAKELVVDFERLEMSLSGIRVDDVYCCLGTTMHKAGSKEAFYRVDYTYTLRLAEIARQNGAKQFLIVTALGAKRGSIFFYNRVKGELERALGGLGFASLVILRPSLLLGARKEKRKGEDIAKKAYKFLDTIFTGPLRKYAGIEAHIVARAMFKMACQQRPGTIILESHEIKSV